MTQCDQSGFDGSTMLRRRSQDLVGTDRIELIEAIENHDPDFHALLPTFLDEDISHATRRHPVDRPNLRGLGTVLALPLRPRHLGPLLGRCA